MRAIWMAAVLAADVAWSSSGAAQPSTAEMAAMSPRETAAAARRDLESLLLFDQARADRRATLRVPGRPFGTRYVGLCQRQFVTISYAHTRPQRPSNVRVGEPLPRDWDNPRNIPVRPAEFAAEREFYFSAAPVPGRQDLREQWPTMAGIAVADCPTSLTWQPGWFTAEGEWSALLGYERLLEAAAAARNGSLRAECELGAVPDHTTCDAELQRIAANVHALVAIRVSTVGASLSAEIDIDNYRVTIWSVQATPGQFRPESVRLASLPILLVE